MNNEGDVVKLLTALPELELRKGELGTIICAFKEPNEAYDIEFLDEEGWFKAQATLLPQDFEVVYSIEPREDNDC